MLEDPGYTRSESLPFITFSTPDRASVIDILLWEILLNLFTFCESFLYSGSLRERLSDLTSLWGRSFFLCSSRERSFDLISHWGRSLVLCWCR